MQSAPILEFSYDANFTILPIAIPAASKIHLIIVRDEHKIDQLTEINQQDRITPWPTSETISPPEPVGVVRLANHGTLGLFDVSYSFVIQIGTQQHPVELGLVDLPAGGRPATFYLVNTTKDGALIFLSKNATAQVQGNAMRQSIDVRSRGVTFSDHVPLLMPSWHKWSGDTILNPNQWKLKKRKPTS